VREISRLGRIATREGRVTGPPAETPMPEWFTDPRCEKDARGLMVKHRPRCQCGWRPALHVTDDGPPAGFEQQVGAALWVAAVDARIGAPEIVTRLAPRVAAAI